jgi:hypothetical protein
MKTKTLLTLFGALAMSALTLASSFAGDSYPLKTCIVSGDVYGGDLGPPVKITYKGREVILCCNSCVKKFNRDPDKYMAILDAAANKK